MLGVRLKNTVVYCIFVVGVMLILASLGTTIHHQVTVSGADDSSRIMYGIGVSLVMVTSAYGLYTRKQRSQ